MELLDRVQGRLALRGVDLANEQRDIHEIDEALAAELDRLGSGDPHPKFKAALMAPEGAAIVGQGKKLKTIKGMGTVYDWRDSPWTNKGVTHGKIKPLIYVQHIPVVPNKPGIIDFVTLRNVLVAQGLMIQSSTDAEGNVALYTHFDVLCYQARGANSFSCGTEHMHMATGEHWNKRQLRAMAWLIQLAEHKHGLPNTRGRLASGSGVARVIRRGQVWHSEVSDAARFHDRSDPWGKPPRHDMHEIWDYVQHCIKFFSKHGHFEGA
jgi:hypothetical protein